MRRRLALLLTLVFLVAACGGGSSSTTTTTEASDDEPAAFEPINDDVLTVGTDGLAKGFFNGDSPDEVEGGFEYAIAEAIAEELGLSKGVKVINVSFDALVTGKAKGFDIAFSQVTVTDERAEVVSFSTPYFSSDQGAMVLKGTEIADVAAAKKLRWGYQATTTAEKVLDQIEPTSAPKAFQATSDLFTALRAKQIDAVMLDTSIVLAEASAGDSPFAVPVQFKTGEEYGAIYPKGASYAEQVDEIIAGLKADGTLADLQETWLAPQYGTDPASVRYIDLP